MLPTVTLLRIDLGSAAPALRDALTLSGSELEALIRAACPAPGAADVVIVADRRRVEIYATDVSRASALRAILPALLARAGGRNELGELPVVEAVGPSAARHLMRLACGVNAEPGREILRELAAAVERSSDAGALGPELSTLFTFAIAAGFRAESETLAGEPSRSTAEPELFELEVDRIVEEELVAWRRASLTAVSMREVPPDSARSGFEPTTFVRRKSPSLRGARMA
jgi:glutamyl-tRNA reductase